MEESIQIEVVASFLMGLEEEVSQSRKEKYLLFQTIENFVLVYSNREKRKCREAYMTLEMFPRESLCPRRLGLKNLNCEGVRFGTMRGRSRGSSL